MAKTPVFQLEGAQSGERLEYKQSTYPQAPHQQGMPYSKLTSLRISQVGVPAGCISRGPKGWKWVPRKLNRTGK